jgi:rare lipoprotein A
MVGIAQEGDLPTKISADNRAFVKRQDFEMIGKKTVSAKVMSTVGTIYGALILACQAPGAPVLAFDQSANNLLALVQPESGGPSFSGNISWYGQQFQGKKTASGEMFDMNKTTAAHRSLGFGTRVLVEDPRTGKSVIVRVNDRGPHSKQRIMDLAKEGARRLGTLGCGVVYADCLVLTNSERQQ